MLDLASGAGGPARILARGFRCHVTCVELLDEFVARARVGASAAGLQQLIDVRQGDARDVVLVDAGWDAVLCLGAAFVWGHVGDAAATLAPAVSPGGHVAIGEPYWRRWPLPEGANDHGYVDLEATVERFTSSGLALTGVIASSEDDWDRYESLHWRALEEWLAVQPDDAEHAAIRAQHEWRAAALHRVPARLAGLGDLRRPPRLRPYAARLEHDEREAGLPRAAAAAGAEAAAAATAEREQ